MGSARQFKSMCVKNAKSNGTLLSKTRYLSVIIIIYAIAIS